MPTPTPNNSAPSNSSITSPNTNNVTPTPVVTKKSVKKKAGYSCLSVGSKVTSRYKLTKGKVYTLSSKGKKKCIVKKKAKKLILKNKFAVKVKVGKKFINIANK